MTAIKNNQVQGLPEHGHRDLSDAELLAVYGGAGNLVGLRAVIQKEREMNAGAWQGLLEAVMREMPHAKRGGGQLSSNAPGHAHATPGIWDSDNGDLAGKPCAWCLAWNEARERIEASKGNPS